MKFKVGDVFFYLFWKDSWMVGKVTKIKNSRYGKEIYFTVITENNKDESYQFIEKFQVDSYMYRNSKIMKDTSPESLLAMIL